jgi:hypothetical protein
MAESLSGPAAVDAFLAEVPEPMGQLARDAAATLRALLPKAHESRAGGDVSFSVGPGYKDLVFTLTPQADHVILGFANGATLTDHTGLFEGRGRGAGARQVHLKAKGDLEKPALRRLMAEAVKRRKR